MIIIHIVAYPLLPRAASKALADHLRTMPVTVVTGARQSGKTTLVRRLTPGPRRYATLDDRGAAEAARRRPEALIGDGPIALDEVQREPGLLPAIKVAVDRDPRPGRFLLTGSANLLLMRRISESLAGRAGYLVLWPMTRKERRGQGRAGIWSRLLDTDDRHWDQLLLDRPEEPDDWRRLVRQGGFPVPALRLRRPADRARWCRGYEQTYIERDLRDLSRVTSVADFRIFLGAAVHRLGQVVNQTKLGRDAALSQPTARRYLKLLETSYLMIRVPAYSVNRTKRLIKSPKLYASDIGLALHLAGDPEPAGAHLENLVFHDLLVWRETQVRRTDLFHWRTTTGAEVDFVIEHRGRLLPIEVKATRRPRFRDARHLLTFRDEYRERARPGLLLHTGEETEWIAPTVFAAPWWRVF